MKSQMHAHMLSPLWNTWKIFIELSRVTRCSMIFIFLCIDTILRNISDYCYLLIIMNDNVGL